MKGRKKIKSVNPDDNEVPKLLRAIMVEEVMVGFEAVTVRDIFKKRHPDLFSQVAEKLADKNLITQIQRIANQSKELARGVQFGMNGLLKDLADEFANVSCISYPSPDNKRMIYVLGWRPQMNRLKPTSLPTMHK